MLAAAEHEARPVSLFRSLGHWVSNHSTVGHPHHFLSYTTVYSITATYAYTVTNAITVVANTTSKYILYLLLPLLS